MSFPKRLFIRGERRWRFSRQPTSLREDPRMNVHKNVSMTPKGRAHLVKEIERIGHRRARRPWQKYGRAGVQGRWRVAAALRCRPPRPCGATSQTPGELLHLDTKKLGQFDKPGHRVTGDRTQNTKRACWQALHVAIDDHSRVGSAWCWPMKQPRAPGSQVQTIAQPNSGPGCITRTGIGPTQPSPTFHPSLALASMGTTC